jgi:hypothetical protein
MIKPQFPWRSHLSDLLLRCQGNLGGFDFAHNVSIFVATREEYRMSHTSGGRTAHTPEERPTLISELDALLQELSAADWWSSRKQRDYNRRDWSKYYISSLKENLSLGYLSAEFIREQIVLLKDPDLKWESVLIGQSVSYKKPRDGKLRWVDVRGVVDPVEASKMVRESSIGRQLQAEGYREYGISAMKARVKVEAAPTLESVGPHL